HVAPGKIAASGPRRERIDKLAHDYGIEVTTDNREVVQRCGVIVLAVKPQILDKVLREIGDHLREGTLVVSIAAGVDTAAIEDAGVKVGLSRRDAQRLAAQTVMGSAKLLLDTDEHPGKLKDMVTSPGGTAIAGLHTLEQGGLRTTLINAVETATKRARELGRG